MIVVDQCTLVYFSTVNRSKVCVCVCLCVSVWILAMAMLAEAKPGFRIEAYLSVWCIKGSSVTRLKIHTNKAQTNVLFPKNRKVPQPTPILWYISIFLANLGTDYASTERTYAYLPMMHLRRGQLWVLKF